MKTTETKRNQVFIALIRGINVGGHAIIKMADVQMLFESLGFANVTTYIQSGNVIFSSHKTNKEKLAGQIEKKFKSSTGSETKMFILTRDKLKKAAAHNPFEPERYEKEMRCQIMFLSAKPDASHSKALIKLKGEEYLFHIHDDVLYYAYSKKYDGKRRMIDFEKVLGVSGTSRTWKVVDKLIELSAG
jgi:uncharacterized protein (DUF1697 family)